MKRTLEGVRGDSLAKSSLAMETREKKKRALEIQDERREREKTNLWRR